MDILQKYLDSIPKVYRPTVNTVINAVLQTLAEADERVATEVQNAKDQLRVATASREYLDLIGNSQGVRRPENFGMSDADFRDLIPLLGRSAKQIRKAFYDVADVFWGENISRANVLTTNYETFNLSNGDILLLSVDGGATQTLKVRSGDVATPGAATALEVVAMFSRIEGVTAEVFENGVDGETYVRLRTNTPGPSGSLEFFTCSAIATGKLEFPLRKVEIQDQAQRFAVYPIRNKELTIEIPVGLPLLKQTLKGSHHFHEDSDLEGIGIPPEVWCGSYFYDPNETVKEFTISSLRTELTAEIVEGSVLTEIDVDDSGDFSDFSEGYLLLDFGKNEEGPIRFRGVPNSTQILIDPTHQFENTHAVGTKVNLVRSRQGYHPRKNGNDYAIYMPSPTEARNTAEDIFETLTAAGIVINFVVLPLPNFEFLIDDPYSD